jgi:hypothetical protein
MQIKRYSTWPYYVSLIDCVKAENSYLIKKTRNIMQETCNSINNDAELPVCDR